MAETTKKFLDFTGLQKYDELLKAKVAADIQKVQDDLNTRKVKDTANSDTITWSKAENGTYTASVKGVVLDNDDYTDVKMKAENSAAAWTKFLTGSSVVYPGGITPVLKDLATIESVNTKDAETLASAKSYADGLASNYAPVSHTHVIGDVTDLQTALDGKAAIDHNHDTVYSKLDHNHDAAYDVKGAAAQALADAKKYADDKVDGKFDAAGSAATAEQNAKAYADGLAKNYDAAGSAEAAKTAAISAAKTYTDGEITKVNETISGINASIAGGVHFRGVVDPLPVSPFTGYVNGDIVIMGNKEYILNKPTEGDGEWVELGDTTAESQRITALEGNVSTLMGNEETVGSVAKALKDAKSYTDGKIDDLVTTGKVKENADAIAILRGADTVEGSVAKALKDAKAYADDKKKEAISDTDTKIATLVGASGQVGINTAAITKLNADSSTVGSVDYKIAQAVSNIEASIETISEAEITGLFPTV